MTNRKMLEKGDQKLAKFGKLSVLAATQHMLTMLRIMFVTRLIIKLQAVTRVCILVAISICTKYIE